MTIAAARLWTSRLGFISILMHVLAFDSRPHFGTLCLVQDQQCCVSLLATCIRQVANGSQTFRPFLSRDVSNTAHNFQPTGPILALSLPNQRHLSLVVACLNKLGGPTMDRNMEQFIRRENLAHYRRLLAEPNVASDPVRHKLLIRLLADQEAKDAIPHGQ